MDTTYSRLACAGCGDRCAHKNCKACGAEFEVKRDRKIFCSAACRNADRQRALCSCKQCGRQFKPKATTRTTFCSRECYFANKSEKAKDRSCEAASGAARVNDCTVCGMRFSSGRFRACCSRECELRHMRDSQREAALARHKQDAKVIECEECRGLFCPLYGSSHAKLCTECKASRARASKAASRMLRKAMERAAKVESVNPYKVFDRDGWLCKLCGVATPKSKRGTYDDDAPELDHITPLSKGGKHTYANVQCACRRCNGMKSDRVGWTYQEGIGKRLGA